MSWKAVVCHRVAHLTPSLAVGTASADFPPFNVSTLDPNIVANVAHASSSYAEFRWDRGAGALNGATCAIMVNHNLKSKESAWILYGGASAGATTNTLVDTQTPTTNADAFAAFGSASTDRHLTLRVANVYGNEGTNIRIGLFSVATHYDLGGAALRSGSGSVASQAAGMQASLIGVPHYAGYSEGYRTLSRTFRYVTHANSEAIQRLLARQWDGTTDSDTTDGVGGGGGGNPTALVDDDGRVFYGPITCNASTLSPSGDEMQLSVQTIPHWGLE